MVTTEDAHKIGSGMFGPDSYTVERREFADGDTRTVVKNTRGPEHDCYIQVQVWVGKCEVWVEYVENDVRRCLERIPLEDFDPESDPWEYIW